jgi:hypothetical protein
MIKKQKGESMKNKKIGVGFHSVANNINSKLLELQQKLRNVELAIDLYEKDLYKIDKRLEKIENEGEECIQEKE